MNVNELFNAITNIRMKVGGVKEDVAFSNSEIVILDDYTISDISYDPSSGIIKASLSKLEVFNEPLIC